MDVGKCGFLLDPPMPSTRGGPPRFKKTASSKENK